MTHAAWRIWIVKVTNRATRPITLLSRSRCFQYKRLPTRLCNLPPIRIIAQNYRNTICGCLYTTTIYYSMLQLMRLCNLPPIRIIAQNYRNTIVCGCLYATTIYYSMLQLMRLCNLPPTNSIDISDKYTTCEPITRLHSYTHTPASKLWHKIRLIRAAETIQHTDVVFSGDDAFNDATNLHNDSSLSARTSYVLSMHLVDILGL